MKKRIRILMPILVILAMLVSLFGTALPVAADAPSGGPAGHGIGVVKSQIGPWTNPDIVMAGDNVTVEITVYNLDSFGHAIRIDSITDAVDHQSGLVSSGELLPSPTTLPMFGSFVTVNYTYLVENGDKNPLIDTAYASGVDLGTNLTVTGSTQSAVTVIIPGINIEKYVSVDGGVTWFDADSATGPSAVVGEDVKFYVSVCNNGTADLTDIVVGDTDFNFTDIATSLLVGQCDNSSVVTVAAVAGQQYDLANVTGTVLDGPNVFDEDPAYYIGLIPGINIEKYVSVDGGVTWFDADSATGPSAVVGEDVKFYVSVCNNGTADLTNIVVSDTDFSFTGVVTSLLAGACDNSSVVTVAAVAGQQWDMANVTAQADGVGVFDEDPAYYRGVKARIVISPQEGTNWVNDSHNLTACVFIDIGAGYVLYNSPIVINFNKTAGVGSLSAASVMTSTGCAQTTLTTTGPGHSTVTAQSAFSFDGLNFDISTDSTGDNSAPAQKTWVDARISIVESGTNPVNTAHNFTVTVEKNDGTGWSAAVGVNVTPSISGVGSITSSGPYITNGSGQVIITVNSAVAGTATVQASATVNVGGVDIAVATNGYGAYIVHNVKEWTSVGGATRTWGFWKTHLALVQWMYDQGIWSSIDMGTWNNYTGGNQTHIIDSVCRYMGLMWSDQSKSYNRKPRYDIDVVRIHAAHQALAAITNSLMPGGAPLPGGMTPASIAATLSSNNITEIGNLASVLTDYNESGDLVPLDPSLQAHQGNANPTGARRAASANCYRYWDTPPKPRH